MRSGWWRMVSKQPGPITWLHTCGSWFWCLGRKCAWNTLEPWAYIFVREE